MQRRRRDDLLFVGLLCLISLTETATVRRGRSPVTVPIGVILDLNSSLGYMALNCTNLGLEDFYSTDDNYSTKIQLHIRHSGNDLFTAASAARDLINEEKVRAILGPQNSEQARFVVELGRKSNVPVIWFSPSGPSLLPPRSRFFINSNSSRSSCFQFKAIAAIIEAYNWQSVIPIYEEPEFGNDLIPCLNYALQDMDTRLPYISAIRQDFTDDNITKELNRIKEKRTYVFLAHMTVELWSRLVERAKQVGMMNEGYAWILTQGLSSVIDPEAKEIKVKGYMNGALGVRPSLIVRPSSVVSTIHKRVYLARRLISKYNKTLSLYGLWAYDTITALANAVEKAGLTNYATVSTVRYKNGSRGDLHKAILDTDFPGLSGNFSLRQGQLEPSQVVVYNVVKGLRENITGYWRPDTGLFRNSVDGKPAGRNKLRDPIWPGNTTERPPKLKIGVPKTHFTEFVNVPEDQNISAAGGFAIDMFKKVVEVLPFNLSYEFVPANITEEQTPTNYDDLLCNITKKNVDVDVIIGDITIVESRLDCVDFTMPYLDSSVSMVVKVRSDSKNGWILLKPFDWLLWLILGVIFVASTLIVIVLERKKMKNNSESKFNHFLRNPFLIYMSDIEFLQSGTSKWVVIVVMFLLGVAVQVYTANLTSILSERTTAKASPSKDLQEIKRNNRPVGYQTDSWVRELLINQIGFKGDQLKPLESREKYNEALSTANETEKVDAIFDETPYLLLLLSKCSDCKMTGPIYKTGGFAFAFRQNSTLVSNFSAAILHVTQNVTMFRDMKRSIFLPVTIDRSEYRNDVEMRSLTKDDFGGLFPIVYSVLALFFTISILKVPSIGLSLRKRLVSVWSVAGGGVIFISC